MHAWDLQSAYTTDRPPLGQLEPGHLRVHPVRHSQLPLPLRALTVNRCSGIHRGMGTHISKVKSVDLDSWTDEQLQSVLKWGNARANKSVAWSPLAETGRIVTRTDTGKQNWPLDMSRRKRTSPASYRGQF